MSWNRSASILSFLVFLAFGFQVVGVFSDPLSRGKLPIASVGRFDYGILGWCPRDSTRDCSGYGIGYTLEDDTSSPWNQSTQKTLSQIFVVHIVAAGLLLISLIMSLATHYRNPRLWTVVEVLLGLSFVAAALSFAVEIALFQGNLKFAGWFTLAATILTLIAVIGLGIMQKRLRAHLGKMHMNNASAFNPVAFQNGNDFVVGRDDDKLLKQPNVSTSHFKVAQKHGFDIPRPPALRTSFMAQKGYEKIPDSRSTTSLPHNSATQSEKTQARNHPLPVPYRGSRENIGAVSKDARSQNYRMGQPNSNGSAQNYGARGGPNVSGLPYGGSRGPNATGGNVPTGRSQMGAAAAAGGAAAAGDAAAAGGVQVLSSAASVSSGHAARVPAGVYVSGVDKTERYGPNVVQIPKVRDLVNTPETASIEYHKDETQSKSPLGASKVPNFSRFSVPEGPNSAQQAQRSVNPMLERFVQSSEMTSDANEAKEPFYDAPMTRIPTQSPESEASHYTSVSERHQQQEAQTKSRGQDAQAYRQQGVPQDQLAQPATNQTQPATYAGYYGYGQGYQGAQYQGNLGNPNYKQPAVGYAEYQPGYQPGYQPNYQPNHQPNYQPAYGPGYQPPYQAGYNGGYNNYPNQYAHGYGAQPRGRARPVQQQPPRSELALQSNPDFSVGSLGKKRLPNRR